MRFLSRIVMFLSIVAFVGCSTQNGRVYSDYDPDQVFTDYRMFSWVSDNPMSLSGDNPVSALTGKRIMQAVKQELKQKGYQYTSQPDEANFLVAFSVGSRENVHFRSSPRVIRYDDWRWGQQYYQVDQVSAYKYMEGSISIDIFDVKRKSPVWHGVASGKINHKMPETESIPVAVSAILESFPPIK